jgi:molybdate transport system substrate-binding protein
MSMEKSRRIVRAVFVLVAVAVLGSPFSARAADIKIIAGAAFGQALTELGPEFERTTGHKLVVKYGIVTTLKQMFEAGEPFDVLIVSADSSSEAAKLGRLAPGTPAPIARTGMVVVTRAGAPKPDVSSVDAFKRVLLEAKSVSYTAGAASGIAVNKAIERLGIADQVKAKAILKQNPTEPVAAVVAGEAELAMAHTPSAMATPGVDLAAFPAEVQDYIGFGASIGATSAQTDAAKALVKHFTSASAATWFKAKGYEPLF